MTALPDLDSAALIEGYRSKAISPVDVAEAVLARIAKAEPVLNAMYIVAGAAALEAARASEARWKRGRPLSKLDGVPITLKENIATKGDPMPVGTGATRLVPKAEDSPAAARVREAGMVILGKTTMPDYGMLSSGRSSFHGTTRNPWNPEMNTSGSSSGAGAAGAAGYGPQHLGTDIGGSVRLPAALCGLFTLKPSLGRIPVDPPFMGRAIGPMTRTVADSAALLTIVSQPDARDHMSLPYHKVDYAAKLEGLSPKGLKIAFFTEGGAGIATEPAMVEAVRKAARALEKEGAIVTEIAPFLTPKMLDGMARFFEARSCSDIMALNGAVRAKILPYIVEWATHRAKKFTGAEVMAAYTEVMAMRDATVRATTPYDFVLSPTTPVQSWPADFHGPTNDPKTALEHIAYTLPYNMSEQPAASLNWHHVNGMPLGIQIAGRRFDDLGVLRISRVLEQLRPKQKAWPKV